ncbi:histidine phosphatase family protein [Desulfogranum marinum]|uniref:histidine phosphatase family protein n=1 Tax=Desulfogranum marinum TaxID=453220 RepID=UPI0022B6EB9B|nr:histidine phosphatase family protein [Desulfogranum marinum]
MKTDSTQIGLIRHSMTLWNEEKKIQGQLDSPLSSRGRAMAETWGETLGALGWQRIISSDLGRAKDTAAIINQQLHIPCSTDGLLREQDWGAWTGLTLAEIKQQDKALLKVAQKKGWQFRPPGGESRQTVLKRSLEALNQASQTWPGQRMLIVCHEGVIKCLLYHLCGRAFLPEEPTILKKYHLHILAMHNSALALTHLNHLPLSA